MSDTLEEARKSLRLATKRASAEAAAARGEGLRITDEDPTGDPEIDARRLDAITELNRQLSSEEAFMVAAGHRHDYRPEPKTAAEVERRWHTDPDEHPEAALARKAREQAAEREAAAEAVG